MRGMVLLVGALCAPGVLAGQLKLVPLDVRVPKNPIPVVSSERAHLVYELRINNLSPTGTALKRLEVLDGDRVVGAWEGDSLRRIVLRQGVRGGPSVDGRIIPGAHQALAYLHVSTPVGSVPKALEHRLYLTHADSLEGPVRDTLRNHWVEVDRTPPPVFRAPLRDGPWVAVNGPGNSSGHRRTVIPLDGYARIAQRFATDWIKLGPDGKAWKGDSTVNSNWYGYGEPLIAVAAGTVVAVKDGIIENVPFSPTMAVPITLETVGGNHVIIDVGNGVYAFYAHIIPGSIKVKVGDKVKAGDVIGSLGNSGNSTAPHLHFHTGDRNSPLGTEGVPFTIDEYLDHGRTDAILTGAWTPTPGKTVKKETPFENHVIRFK